MLKRSSISRTITIVVLCLLSVVTATGQTSKLRSSDDLSVWVPEFSAAPGDWLTVPIEVSDTTGFEIVSVNLTFSYDPDVLIAYGVSTTELTSGWMLLYYIKPGDIQLTMYSPFPLEGAGAVVDILFQVNMSAEHGAISPLTLENIVLSRSDGSSIPLDQVSHGRVIVTICGAVVGTVNDVITGEPLKALVLALKVDTTDKAGDLTDADGYYDISDVAGGLYWVIAIKTGYSPGVTRAKVVAGETTTVDFMLIPKLE